MTLILKLDLDIVKMYQHTKSEVSMLTVSKVIGKHTHTHTHTQTQTQTDMYTDRHTDITKHWSFSKCTEMNLYLFFFV